MTHSNAVFGTYAPTKKPAQMLQFLTKIGLGRGGLSKRFSILWRKWHGDWIDIEIRGIRYRLNLSDNITDNRILCSSKEYDAEELKALGKACGDGGVFVDVGANIGYYSLAMAKSGASKIVSIEANPRTVERLNYNIQLNDCASRVDIVACGVGSGEPCELFFSGDLGSATLIESASNKSASVRVETKPLLSILKDAEINEVSGMKIDIEGFENYVLRPFFEQAQPTLWPKCLVIENCHYDAWGEDLVGFLLNKGYQTASITRSNTILNFFG